MPGHDMHIEVLGTESLSVRGLSCVVEVENRKIVIDPGLALGYRRHGLLPHPAQVAVGEQVCRYRGYLETNAHQVRVCCNRLDREKK